MHISKVAENNWFILIGFLLPFFDIFTIKSAHDRKNHR